jgi:hypothetical protein
MPRHNRRVADRSRRETDQTVWPWQSKEIQAAAIIVGGSIFQILRALGLHIDWHLKAKIVDCVDAVVVMALGVKVIWHRVKQPERPRVGRPPKGQPKVARPTA